LKEWTTPDIQNIHSTTNLEEEEIVDALGNDSNTSMLKQVNQPNPWRKMMMMNIQLGVSMIVSSIMQFISLSSNLLSLRSKHFPQHLK